MKTNAVESPCIKVCAIDGETSWCLGCGRTLPEITEWIKMGPEGREEVLAVLDSRIDILTEKGKR